LDRTKAAMSFSHKKNFLALNSGFSLIELMVAMALASILMAGIATAYWVQTQTAREQQMVVEMQQNMRAAMYFLQRDIRMAGYDGDKNSGPSATITIAQPDSFAFQFVDDTDTRVTVTYNLVGEDLTRTESNGGPADVIAQDIEALEFFYTLEDATQSTDPLNETPPGELEDIRVVGVSLLARTSAETRSGDTAQFTLLSGDTVGPFTDGFKRQLLTATIKCRNMTED